MKLIYIEMDSLPCQLPIICQTGILLTNNILQARDFPPATTPRQATLQHAFLTSKEKLQSPYFRSVCCCPRKVVQKKKKSICGQAFYQIFHPEVAFEKFVIQKNLLQDEENSGDFCEKLTTTPPTLHSACAPAAKIILFLHSC